MQTVTKKKIAAKIEQALGLSAVICEELVTQIFKSATNLILQDQGLKIKNFGSFEVVQKNARPGMNIQTNSPVSIEPRKVIRFSPSRNLKKRLNSDK